MKNCPYCGDGPCRSSAFTADGSDVERFERLHPRDRRDPRNDPDDAYEIFMAMPQSEWLGLIASLIKGGVLTPAESAGFHRACDDRKKVS